MQRKFFYITQSSNLEGAARTEAQSHHLIQHAIGDQVSHFGNKKFDLVFDNGVTEYVGDPQRRA